MLSMTPISKRKFMEKAVISSGAAGFLAASASNLSAPPLGLPIGSQVWPTRSMIVTLLCFVLLASLQSAEPWTPLFNGKDFTGWTVPARGDGPSLSPAEAGWKMEDGIIVGGRAGPGQKGGSLVSLARFKDFELEVDFMLAEQPAAPDGSCTTCTYNSGVYLRTGYQVNFGRREAG